MGARRWCKARARARTVWVALAAGVAAAARHIYPYFSGFLLLWRVRLMVERLQKHPGFRHIVIVELALTAVAFTVCVLVSVKPSICEQGFSLKV